MCHLKGTRHRLCYYFYICFLYFGFLFDCLGGTAFSGMQPSAPAGTRVIAGGYHTGPHSGDGGARKQPVPTNLRSSLPYSKVYTLSIKEGSSSPMGGGMASLEAAQRARKFIACTNAWEPDLDDFR